MATETNRPKRLSQSQWQALITEQQNGIATQSEFCRSKGLCLATFIQSLLVSCRLQDIDLYKYLVDVLQRVSLHPARQINELIPRNWKERFGKNSLKAPLDK